MLSMCANSSIMLHMGMCGHRINKIQQRILDALLSNNHVFIDTLRIPRGSGISTIIAHYLIWEFSTHDNIENMVLCSGVNRHAEIHKMCDIARQYSSPFSRIDLLNVSRNLHNSTTNSKLVIGDVKEYTRGVRLPNNINTVCIDDSSGMIRHILFDDIINTFYSSHSPQRRYYHNYHNIDYLNPSYYNDTVPVHATYNVSELPRTIILSSNLHHMIRLLPSRITDSSDYIDGQ